MKYVLYAILLIFALKYGYTYLHSDDFQKYGDENKAQWTCRVNNLIGVLNLTLSHYEQALMMYQPVLKRCPKTSMSEEASFRIAICLESLGRRSEAIGAYRKYAETYKGSKRARIATKAADLLTSQ